MANEVFLRDGGRVKEVKEFYTRQKAVCILKGNCWSGTGFYVNLKCGDEVKLGLMTCHHTEDAGPQDWAAVEALFNYIDLSHTGDLVALKPDLFHYVKPDLDFRFLGIDIAHLVNLGVEAIPCLKQPPKLVEGTEITIFQHPLGLPKCFSQDKVLEIVRPYFRYRADTADGSSGAPVFAYVQNQMTMELVGLHKRGKRGQYNEGVLMDEIIQCLSTGDYIKPRQGPGDSEDARASSRDFITNISSPESLIAEVKKCSPDLNKIKDFIEKGNISPNCTDQSNNSYRPLHYAVMKEQRELVEELLRLGADPNLTDKFNLSPLHWAAENDNVDIAKVLIDHKANVEATTKNEGQGTPLHHAVRKKHCKMVKFLLEYGKADVNARDKGCGTDGCGESKTPLHVAVEDKNNFDVMKTLVECGADVTIKDSCNETAYMIASSKRHQDMAEYLKARESSSNSGATLSTQATQCAFTDGQPERREGSEGRTVHYTTTVISPRGTVIIGSNNTVTLTDETSDPENTEDT